LKLFSRGDIGNGRMIPEAWIVAGSCGSGHKYLIIHLPLPQLQQDIQEHIYTKRETFAWYLPAIIITTDYMPKISIDWAWMRYKRFMDGR